MRQQIWRLRQAFHVWRDTRDWPPGTIYEDCAYEPLVLVKIDRLGDMHGVRLRDGQPGRCSFYHCGPRKIALEEAVRLL